jgi:hypothetical protein
MINKKIYVHVGVAKTGTTSFQKLMFENKSLFESQCSLIYPGTQEHHWALAAYFDDKPENNNSYNYLELPQPEKQTWLLNEINRIREDSLSSPASTVLLSTEHLAPLSLENLTKLAHYLRSISNDITIIAAMRDPWGFCVSSIAEDIRNGALSGDVEFGYQEGTKELLSKYSDGISQDLRLVPYLTGVTHNVQSLLLAIIGIDFNDVITNDRMKNIGRENQQSSHEVISILTRFNEKNPMFDERGVFIPDPLRDWGRDAILNSESNSIISGLSEIKIAEIYTAAYEDLDYIQKKYLDNRPVYFDYYSNYLKTALNKTGHSGFSMNNISSELIFNVMADAIRNANKRAMSYYLEAIDFKIKFLTASGRPEEANNTKKFYEYIKSLAATKK